MSVTEHLWVVGKIAKLFLTGRYYINVSQGGTKSWKLLGSISVLEFVAP